MRVVWITHNYPRAPGDIPGNFLHPLAVTLRALGVDVRVVAPSDAGEVGSPELDGVPVRRVRYGRPAAERLAYRGTMGQALRSPSGVLGLLRLRRALRAGAMLELRDADPADRLVHAHWWIPGGWAAPADIPLVLTSHGTDVRLLDQRPMSALVARSVFRRARVVTAVSRSLAETLHRRVGITVADDAVQPMPVVEAERPATDRSGGLVVIGRLTPQKRVDLAIDAFALLIARDQATTLTVIGDGPEREHLVQRAASLGLGESIVFAGPVPPTSVGAFLGAATCCLVPSRLEGFGIVAAEALMQGVPVIACRDGGGLLDVVPATGPGRVVDPTAEALAGAVQQLTADDTAYRAAREAAAYWQLHLSADFVADRCLAWYQQALDA